ncbi:hypothetical protein [Staphylococcus massiliensis]|uniref:Uncharacterized protein n=1 Tax=Staphylococcus massiliensis S46 TaxID=1229783 RepID=K9B2J9_9STAP|nr:hypothetical protein [Staphylococcus massiliensis]EKU49022.1 hypothetical protein C273_04435 [Staphylococcus massiliensis S46]MCG3399464.1 hypothetical protein [Staphylococcus massiliensis]MCG3402436.1 hypothetical protein [Staphylococcus massiliensis]MCG3411600.1 hypothetical protein [Staphylococcus massiliensis]PNZ99497.1 hypothetical protein CD133_06320 [Staphylococcus massiliensis CCUG 55927]
MASYRLSDFTKDQSGLDEYQRTMGTKIIGFVETLLVVALFIVWYISVITSIATATMSLTPILLTVIFFIVGARAAIHSDFVTQRKKVVASEAEKEAYIQRRKRISIIGGVLVYLFMVISMMIMMFTLKVNVWNAFIQITGSFVIFYLPLAYSSTKQLRKQVKVDADGIGGVEA